MLTWSVTASAPAVSWAAAAFPLHQSSPAPPDAAADASPPDGGGSDQASADQASADQAPRDQAPPDLAPLDVASPGPAAEPPADAGATDGRARGVDLRLRVATACAYSFATSGRPSALVVTCLAVLVLRRRRGR
jgi:hypothetical protein